MYQYVFTLYVDGMLILGTNVKVINKTNKMLIANFGMKDMGEPDMILIMKIYRTYNGIILCQSHYINKVIDRFKSHVLKRQVIHFFLMLFFIRILEMKNDS